MFYIPSPSTENTNLEFESIDKEITHSSGISDSYKSELQILEEKDKDYIQSYAVAGNLRTSKIRSLHWRILLGVLPSSPSKWLPCIEKLRIEYEGVKRDFYLDPHKAKCKSDDNPLSQDTNSIWFRYFCDKELRRVIGQDVIRTSPEKQFFQSQPIQEIMINVLFNYARKNPDICYRQGMHEILASTLYVIYEDCQSFKDQKVDPPVNAILGDILDLKYLEHDVFYLFSHIMNRMNKFYESDNNSSPNACGHFPTPSSEIKSPTFEENGNTGVSLYINILIRNTLAVHDPILYQHMKKLNIPFIAFGIRWLRLLFGREFSLSDLFVLWDAIFALDSEFCLVNHILTAMLITIRDKLLNRDYVECLNYLMNYPSTVDVMFIVKLALHLKEPTVYRKPLLPIIKNVKTTKTISNDNDSGSVTNTMINQAVNRSLRKKKKQLRSKDREGFKEEYSSKSYDMIRSEVKHLRVVMSLCKLKLCQYHDILASSLSSDDIKAQHALTGIQELCTLLEVDQFSFKPSPSIFSEIEQAREADEIPSPSFSKPETSFFHASQDLVALYLPPPKTEIDMTTFRKVEYTSMNSSNFPPAFPHKPGVQD